MPQRIHTFSKYSSHVMPQLKRVFPDVDVVGWSEEKEFADGIGGVEYLLTLEPPKSYWPQAEKLKLVHSMGAGIDHLMPLKGLPAGVHVANASGVMAEPMAEFGLALVLMLVKRINWAVAKQTTATWELFTPAEVRGSTLGILGLGRIGIALARRAQALGMRVIGTRRTPRPTDHVDEVFGADQTAEVLRQSDVVVCLLPYTEETVGLLDESMMRQMKMDSALINLGRGGQVDENALVQVLKDGHLSGAALDVFEQEPLPADSPLWTAPNLVITPHAAGGFAEYLPRLAELFAENVRRVEAGEAPLTPVDPILGY